MIYSLNLNCCYKKWNENRTSHFTLLKSYQAGILFGFPTYLAGYQVCNVIFGKIRLNWMDSGYYLYTTYTYLCSIQILVILHFLPSVDFIEKKSYYILSSCSLDRPRVGFSEILVKTWVQAVSPQKDRPLIVRPDCSSANQRPVVLAENHLNSYISQKKLPLVKSSTYSTKEAVAWTLTKSCTHVCLFYLFP